MGVCGLPSCKQPGPSVVSPSLLTCRMRLGILYQTLLRAIPHASLPIVENRSEVLYKAFGLRRLFSLRRIVFTSHLTRSGASLPFVTRKTTKLLHRYSHYRHVQTGEMNMLHDSTLQSLQPPVPKLPDYDNRCAITTPAW